MSKLKILIKNGRKFLIKKEEKKKKPPAVHCFPGILEI
jgi:hypothetical protein